MRNYSGKPMALYFIILIRLSRHSTCMRLLAWSILIIGYMLHRPSSIIEQEQLNFSRKFVVSTSHSVAIELDKLYAILNEQTKRWSSSFHSFWNFKYPPWIGAQVLGNINICSFISKIRLTHNTAVTHIYQDSKWIMLTSWVNKNFYYFYQ